MIVILDSNPEPELLVEVMSLPQMRLNFSDSVKPSLDAIQKAMQSPDCALGLFRNEEGKIMGFFCIRWMNPVTVKLSGGFIEACRGKVAKEAISLLIAALFSRSAVVKIVGEVFEANKASMRMAGALGFRREGLNRQSVMVGGKLVDQVYYGLCRSEWNGGPDFRH